MSVITVILVWLLYLWFLWLPFLSAFIFWNIWLQKVRTDFLSKLSWVLLEVKIPREIAKSPRAMEAVLSSLYNASSGSWWKRVRHGFLQHWYSLEIASINGQVRFFVYTQKFARNLVESQIYAHYPQSEIIEMDDYTYASDYENLDKWEIWSSELALTKADPYPIKTFVDFGLHETSPKEEQKVNPLVSFLEYLGSLQEGEQVWFQIMIKGAGKEWVNEGKTLIDKLMGRDKPLKEGEHKKSLSKGENEVVAAIEKNIAKLGFHTAIRILYVARKDIFDPVNNGSLLGLMNQYNTQNLNGFKPSHSTGSMSFVAKHFFKKKKEMENKWSMLNAYRHRSYFYCPVSRKPFVFNIEELATIYHYPGSVAETPAFARIESKKSGPPINLPV